MQTSETRKEKHKISRKQLCEINNVVLQCGLKSQGTCSFECFVTKMGNRYSDLLEYVQKCLEIQYIDKQINKKQSLCSSYKLECHQVATATFIL